MSQGALMLFDALRLERRALALCDGACAQYWRCEAELIAGLLIAGSAA